MKIPININLDKEMDVLHKKLANQSIKVLNFMDKNNIPVLSAWVIFRQVLKLIIADRERLLQAPKLADILSKYPTEVVKTKRQLLIYRKILKELDENYGAELAAHLGETASIPAEELNE